MAAGMRLLNLAFLFVFASILAACSSSRSINIDEASQLPIEPDRSVSLQVNSTDEDSNPDLKTELQSNLYSRLVSEGLFADVASSDTPADYKMQVSVSGVNEVSTAARVVFGVLAGANTICADVQLNDQ